MKISKRALSAPYSPIRYLHPFAVQAEKRGIKIYRLNIGQPDFEAPTSVLNEIKNSKIKKIAYTPSQGTPEAINAWQKYLKGVGLNYKSNEIVVTTGGSEAIFFAMAAVADPGEEILVFEPMYCNYLSFAAINSIKLVSITLKIADGFHLPKPKEIERKITKKTKAIILNNPNNPTGAVYTKKELFELAQLVRKYHLFVINDEVYREFVFDENKFYSINNFKNIEQQIILVDSVSKRFNLCGARIGCLSTKNKEIYQSILKFCQGRLSPPFLEQVATRSILKNSKKYTDWLINEYNQRRKTAEVALKKIPKIKFTMPEGAFYCIVQLPVKNAEHFSRWLLEKFSDKKETVMVAPASGFYQTKNMGLQEVRIAFVYEPAKLQRAIELIGIALNKYQK